MTLFSTPDEHASNGPDTWRVEKVHDRLWAILTAKGDVQNGGDRLETYPTRKSAVQGLESGWAASLWEKERRWYAGQTIPGWKPWTQVKEERERNERWQTERKAQREREERRKVERLGITVDKLGEWREALAGLHIERDSDNPGPNDDDAAEAQRERLDAALDAFHAVLRLIESGDLMDPAHLDDEEAQALHHDLSQTWALETGAEYWIDRIRYKGLDTDLSALEVLDLMVQAEREEVMPGLKAVAA